MSYIGASPTTTAFVTDSFNGNASTTAFTMSVAPANPSSALVAISGVLQDPTTYAVSGTTLTFSSAPPVGTGNISVRYLGIPASGITTTAYRTLTEFTATAGQTTFSPPSYSVGYINVYRNGSRLGTADFTATNGTSVILNNAAGGNDLIAIESFYITSVTNALPQTGGVINAPSGAVALQVQSNNVLGLYQDASANVGIGTSSMNAVLNVQSNGTSTTAGGNVVLRLQSNATGRDTTLQLSDNVTNSITISQLAGSTIFRTNGTESMRINASSQVLIGTTAPSGKVTIAAGTGTGLAIDQSGTTGNGTGLYIKQPVSNGYAPFEIDNSSGSSVFQVESDGRVNLYGGGIVFPANQIASANANTLDDYEEGTWTPTLFHSNSNNASWGSRVGYYVKIGGIVHCWWLCDSGNSGTAGSALKVSGLPFTTAATNLGYGTGGIWGTNGSTLSGNHFINSGSNLVQLFRGGQEYSEQQTFGSGYFTFRVT